MTAVPGPGAEQRCECVSRMDTSKCPKHGARNTWRMSTPHTHGCAQCGGQMEVYVAHRSADHRHAPTRPPTDDPDAATARAESEASK